MLARQTGLWSGRLCTINRICLQPDLRRLNSDANSSGSEKLKFFSSRVASATICRSLELLYLRASYPNGQGNRAKLHLRAGSRSDSDPHGVLHGVVAELAPTHLPGLRVIAALTGSPMAHWFLFTFFSRLRRHVQNPGSNINSSRVAFLLRGMKRSRSQFPHPAELTSVPPCLRG